MNTGKVVKKTRGNGRNTKVVQLDTSDECEDEQSADLPAFTITKVTVTKPNQEDELDHLDKAFAVPVLQDVLLGNAPPMFPLIITNKRGSNTETTILGRDRIHASSAFVLSKKAVKAMQSMNLPTAVNITKYSLNSDGAIHIDDLVPIKTGCTMGDYIASRLPVPQFVTVQSVGCTKAVKMDIFDLDKETDRAELVVQITNVAVKHKSKGTGRCLLFEATDATGNMSGRLWDNVEKFEDLLLNGAHVSIKFPKIAYAKTEFNKPYSSPFQLTIIRDRTQITTINK
ncbi:uncharacterized protein LOC129594476 [Paramacrobiotus metropolitanus]|uniref:uncharacterized protein LOC129594476 n=1 Tax=Paramacrobiotus metropolitanus TaxID=2943436 RepID=UPI0024463130|nr:uncharacterized protein LOC129594476 [Paramacrobiotus metropolitanus]